MGHSLNSLKGVLYIHTPKIENQLEQNMEIEWKLLKLDYVGGLCQDNGKENGNYYSGFRV